MFYDLLDQLTFLIFFSFIIQENYNLYNHLYNIS